MGSSREERRRRFHEDLDAHEVRVIPAKEEYCIDIREKDELVGAYCRVSTMSDDQVESYDLQRQEYEDKIAQNKHWTLVDLSRHRIHRSAATDRITLTKYSRRVHPGGTEKRVSSTTR